MTGSQTAEPEQMKELFLLDRASLLSLVDLVHAAIPGVSITIEPTTISRAQVRVERSTPTNLSWTNGSGLDFAEKIYRFRRRRDQAFGVDLFADPAWDLLLDLYIAEKRGKRVSISSACIAAATPASTSQRWVRALCKRGILLRSADETDRRKSNVMLAPETFRKMDDLLS